MAATRELDVVLYGATGFVGKLTAEYLAGAAPDERAAHRPAHAAAVRNRVFMSRLIVRSIAA